MKKLTFCFRKSGFIAAFLCVYACGVSAQEIHTFGMMQIPDGSLIVPCFQAISSNHSYVTGPAIDADNSYPGIFVYDWAADKIEYAEAVDAFGGDMRAVTDDGVSVGYNGPALTFSFDTGKSEPLAVPNETSSCVARDITDDKSIIVGDFYDNTLFISHACYWKNGLLTALPEPGTDEAGFEVNGTTADFVSADGSVIVGTIVDNFNTKPMILWRLQKDGTYKCDIVCKDYFHDSRTSLSDDKPYRVFTPGGLSRNGRYISLSVADVNSTVQRMARYDLTTGTLADAPILNTDAGEMSCICTGIADDGTIVGYALEGDFSMQNRLAAIWPGGEDYPKLLADDVPSVEEIGTYDLYKLNTVCDVTPDGRWVTGFAYTDAGYESWILDRGENSSGINVSVDGSKECKETSRYTLGGMKIRQAVKGVNIIRMSDGTVRKVLVK